MGNEQLFGYARVSAKDMNPERQIQALLAAGVEERNIYIDKSSGKTFNRPQYNALIGTADTSPRLRAGDTLVICSIDRLGRNYSEIGNEWRKLTIEMEVDIVVLDMPILNTSSKNNSLDKKFMANLVLEILSYVAEKERLSIKERQRQGIDVMPILNGKKVSKKTGKPTGRPAAEYPETWPIVYPEWKSGSITAVEAMKKMSLKKNTFYTLVKRYEKRH